MPGSSLANVREVFFLGSLQISDAKTRRRVLAKDLAGPYIAPQSCNRLVARLAHDHKFPHAVHGGLGDAACAEGVAAERINVHSGPRCSSLQELSNRVLVQAPPRYMSVAADRTEDWAIGNLGGVQPLAQRQDWTCLGARSGGQAHLASRALLIRFRLADGDDHAVGREFQIIYIDTGQFRSPEAARESNQNQSCVSKSQQILAPSGGNSRHVQVAR